MGDTVTSQPSKFNGMWPVIALGITLVLNLGVAASQLWVKSGYVPKSEFEAYKAEQLAKRESTSLEFRSVAVELGKMNVKMEENAQQDARLERLETKVFGYPSH
jgi:hypothetical protein